MSDSDKAEHRCSTSLSPSRKNEETHATVFRARTRSEKRNESMTVSNKTTCEGQLPTPTSTKKAKDTQTSMKPVNFNGKIFCLRVDIGIEDISSPISYSKTFSLKDKKMCVSLPKRV